MTLLAQTDTIASPALEPVVELPGFRFFGPSHYVALGIFAIIVVGMVVAARHGSPRWVRIMEKAAGLYMLAYIPVTMFCAWPLRWLTPDHLVPLHVCDLVSLAAGVALLTRRQLAVEITYFWGIAATANGLITPSLTVDFPDLHYFTFFWLHAGVVATALYLVLGPRLWPHPGSVKRVILVGYAYLLIVGLIDWIFGWNYGFLCGKPPTASLFDALGPWPWYLLSVQALAIGMFFFLYAPIWGLGRRNGLGAAGGGITAEALPTAPDVGGGGSPPRRHTHGS